MSRLSLFSSEIRIILQALSSNELEQFLQVIPNSFSGVDEAYYEYVQTDTYPQTVSLLKDYPNLLITRTFSKIYGLAALRVGYGIADPAIISTLARAKEPFNVNTLAQAAALASLNDPEHVQKSIELNEQGSGTV